MLTKLALRNNYIYFPKGVFNSSRVISAVSKRNITKKEFLKFLGIKEKHLVFPKQIHGLGVVYVKEKLSHLYIADSLFTDKKNLALAVFTADCVPIFLYEKKNNLIGIIHAGWRNTKDNILKETLAKIKRYFYIDLDNLYLAFGPSIRLCCYEIKEDVARFFSPYLIFKKGRTFLDLVEINKDQALNLGIKERNIFDSKICTSCKNDEFYSFRKGDGTKRIISLIMLK